MKSTAESKFCIMLVFEDVGAPYQYFAGKDPKRGHLFTKDKDKAFFATKAELEKYYKELKPELNLIAKIYVRPM